MEYTDSAYVDAIYEKLCQRKHAQIVSGLKPNSVYTLDVESPDFVDLFVMNTDGFKDAVKSAIFRMLEEQYTTFNIPQVFGQLDIKLIGKTPVEMHDINSKFENTVITFDCIISATDSPKTYIKKALATCPLCFGQEEVKCNFEKKIPIALCSNPPCKKAKMSVSANQIQTDDVQTLFFQESLEKARHSSPVVLTGKVYGSDVSTSYVGQKKRVTGIFRSIINSETNENDVYIDVLSINNLEEEEDVMPTEQEESQFRTMAKEKTYLDNLVNSFAPNIYGMSDIKLSILLQLVGGVKSTKRSDINIFLVGDPSMAKSELLKYAKKITKKSIYTSGRGTSAAGLTIAVVKINDRFVAQAGVLPLCNNGFAMIDEFDKMNKDDRSAMHEAMEQQTASVAKAGIVLTLPTKTTILAAANPKYGAYDPDSTLRDNVDIPVPLLSRFDLIWLIRDTVNVTEDMMKATHIIDSFESTSTGKKECSLSEELLKKLLNLARQQSPRINDDVKNEIIKIYNQMRAVSSNDELPVGVRQLEALIRLSYALAKLRLKDFVELDDVLTVKSLIESMYNSFNLTMNSGNRQTILTGTTRQTKQQLADKIWSECEDENGSVNIIEFMKKLIENGFEPMEAKKMFGNWERFNQIRLNSDGTYRKA